MDIQQFIADVGIFPLICTLLAGGLLVWGLMYKSGGGNE